MYIDCPLIQQVLSSFRPNRKEMSSDIPAAPTKKDGGRTTGSAISENPMPHANLVALSVIELWPIEVYIAFSTIIWLL